MVQLQLTSVMFLALTEGLVDVRYGQLETKSERRLDQSVCDFEVSQDDRVDDVGPQQQTPAASSGRALRSGRSAPYSSSALSLETTPSASARIASERRRRGSSKAT